MQEQRQRQAEAIRRWKPWTLATGPTTDVDPGFSVVGIVALPYPFHFKIQEEALSNSVIPTVSLAAHAADEAIAG